LQGRVLFVPTPWILSRAQKHPEDVVAHYRLAPPQCNLANQLRGFFLRIWHDAGNRDAELACARAPCKVRNSLTVPSYSGVFLQQRKLVSDFVPRSGVWLDISDGFTVETRHDVTCCVAMRVSVVSKGAGASKTSVRRGDSSPPEIAHWGVQHMDENLYPLRRFFSTGDRSFGVSRTMVEKRIFKKM
jgi:hypothetical protein